MLFGAFSMAAEDLIVNIPRFYNLSSPKSNIEQAVGRILRQDSKVESLYGDWLKWWIFIV